MARQITIKEIANQLNACKSPHPLRVAIDGVDAAGKTTLANELALMLQNQGRSVIRASIDGFHNPREQRYQLGPNSPEGYFKDSFNYAELKKLLLEPLGPGGTLEYRKAIFDYHTEAAVDNQYLKAAPDSILLFDGVFLLRPELLTYWDFKIFVEISLETSLERGSRRDQAMFGSLEAAQERYQNRYLPGQNLYLEQCKPRDRCDIVIINEDLDNPVLVQRAVS